MKTGLLPIAAAALLLVACDDGRGETMTFRFNALDKEHADSERGCNLRHGPGVIFFRAAGQSDGVINLGNSDVRMAGKEVADFSNMKVGDTREERYDLHGSTVTIQWKATKVCSPEEKNCAGVEMDADFAFDDPHGGTAFKAMGTCRP